MIQPTREARDPMGANDVIRTMAVFLTILALPALAGSETPTWKQFPSTNKPRKNVMVQFTDASLHPSVAQVVEGGIVSWVNYATMSEGSIVFSDEMATAFTCSDLSPNWMKTETGYHSLPITTGGAMNELEIPCPLKPGEYEYEVWLFSGSMGDPAPDMGDPQSRMQGKIVVK